MRRRAFIEGIAALGVAWPLAARAQQAAMPVIGFLNSGSSKAFQFLVAAFRQGLSESGYEEIGPTFEKIKGHFDAVFVPAEPLANTNRKRISSFALALHLPTLFASSEYVEAGGLMSYGPNYPDLYRRTADFVDKILRGAKPAEMPVEQPTKFDLAVNLTTAEVLGLSLPTTFLARADEVIE
jgi:putative ABC transport system substrate-binding protein